MPGLTERPTKGKRPPCARLGLFRQPLVAEDFQGSTHPLPYDEEIINYSAQTPTDRIAKLQARIASGEVKLKWDEQVRLAAGAAR